MPPVMFSVVTKYHKGRHSLFLYNLEIFCAFTQDILRSRIFTGMAQGPESIDANFNALDGKINTLIPDTGWVKVALVNATGNVFVRKIGKHVMMRGSFKTTANSSVTNQIALVNGLPDEFKSTTSYSPIIELAGPWDPKYITVQANSTTGGITQIGGTQGTTVEVEAVRWEVD